MSIAGFYLPPKKSEQSNRTNQLENAVEKLNIDESKEKNEKTDEFTKEDTNNNELNESDKNEAQIKEEGENEEENDESTEEEDEEDDDNVGWITPANLETVKKQNLNELEEDINNLNIKVACMTSDFAMQVSFQNECYLK